VPTRDQNARALYWAALGLILLAVLASVLARPHLPERMPTHWGLEGEPTNLAPRAFALIVMPVMMVWIGFLMSAIGYSVGQTREARDMPAWISPAITAGVLVVMLASHLSILAWGLGFRHSVPLVATAGVGLLLILVGWLTPKAPPNPYFGVRTRATLECPDTWREANRIGGRAMLVAGVVTLLGAPLPGGWAMGVMFAALIGATIVALRAARRPVVA
jgi:uncharacterized membrane protein